MRGDNPSESPPAGDGRVEFIDIPALVIFALLFFTVALQFFTRYVLNDSLGWTEEIARYFLILLCFFGCVICARNNSHIALEFFYRYLPAAAVRRLIAFCQLTTGAFFFFCGWLAIELAQRTSSNMASFAAPKSVIYYLVSLACVVTGVFAVAALRRGRRD